jgi:hypothetical protein
MSELGRLLTSFRRTAFRLETRQHYLVPEETAAFERFLRGGPPESQWTDEWTQLVAAATSDGKRMQRVRVVQEPLSPYVRFELTWGSPNSVAAGEQIHVLVDEPGQVQAPREDFWLFDGTIVVRLRYDGDGRFLGADTVTDPAAVTRHRQVRDNALARAIPLERYTALTRS